MSPDVLVPVLGLFAGLTLAVLAALRFQREDAGRVVAQQGQVFENLTAFTNELQEQLSDARAERRRVEAELAESNGTNRQLEANLRACTHRVERLEQRLIDLGEDPNAV